MEDQDRDFTAFISKVKQTTFIDLAQYKEAQMKRRLTSLMNKHGYDNFLEYFEELTRNKEMLFEFLDRLTINVSEFWRNPNRWEVLQQKFLPSLIRSGRRLKCWSAACSTGEEPYSLAMILSKMKVQSDVSIFATDLDEGALEKARRAVYLEHSIKDVPAEYIKLFFEQDGLTYKLSDEISKKVQFSKGDLLNDIFERGFDLIICRNVMIYFTEDAKQKLIMKFAQALKPGGILFVGSTEQIFSPEKYGMELAETFFYRKLRV